MKELLKPVKIVTVCLLVLLLSGALIYWKERMLFLDAPHTLFRIINGHSFIITVGRYGSFVTQLLPLAGVQLHLPLAWIMILYSCSFNLFFLVAGILLLYAYKRWDLALLFALYLTLFTSDTYFWTNNEVHEGVTWLMLGFGIHGCCAARRRHFLVSVPVFALLFFLAIWTHPLVMTVALYLWFFLWGRGAGWPYSKKESAGYTLLLLVLIYVKYYQSSHNWYDGAKLDVVKEFHFSKVLTIYKAPQFHYFAKSCITDYWIFVLLFLIGNLGLLRSKKYFLFALSMAFTAGYVVLVCITFWDVNNARFYFESEYMPLAIIGTAPFVYYVLPALRKNQVMILLAFIFLVRIGYVVHSAPVFSRRVALLKMVNEKLREKKLSKAIMPDNNNALDAALIMNWGLPVETLMCSALSHDKPQHTVVIADSNALTGDMAVGRDTLLACFEKRPQTAINSNYFQTDTTAGYVLTTYDVLMK